MVAVPHAMAELVAADIIPHTAAPRHGDAAGIIPCGRGPEPAARSASNSLRQHHQSAAEKLVSLSRGTATKMAGDSWLSSRGTATLRTFQSLYKWPIRLGQIA